MLANNVTANPDENGEFDDWLELYNAGSQAVDLASYGLTDDPRYPHKYRLPSGFPSLTTIPPGGFLLIWCDGDGAQGPLHANFRLAADGEFVGLSSPNNQVLDSITYPGQLPDNSYGRSQDGGSLWQHFDAPTPGTKNTMVGVNSALAEDLKIYPNPATDWVLLSSHEPFVVLNMNGQEVASSDAQGLADVRALAPGMYFIGTHIGFSSKFLKH